jgi:hypothetical protein
MERKKPWEHGDKIGGTDREKIEAALKDLKESLDSPEQSIVQQKMEALTQVAMVLGEAVYKASQEQTSSEIPDESATVNKEDIVDVDYEDVESSDEKKDDKEKKDDEDKKKK